MVTTAAGCTRSLAVAMARPPTPIGAWGEIHVNEIRPGVFEAAARIRMQDGRSRLTRATARGSETAAKTALRKKLQRLSKEATGHTIDGDIRVGPLIDKWLDDLEKRYRLGKKSMQTIRQYRGYANNWIKPVVGELTGREFSYAAYQCDKIVTDVYELRSFDAAKSVRAVLRGFCAYGVRVGALTLNPAKSIGRIERQEKREVKAMTYEQRAGLLDALREYGQQRQTDKVGRKLGARGKVWLDLPDIAEAMLATGERIGEILAAHGDNFDSADAELAITHHLVRDPGVGLVRMPLRKSGEPALILGVPDWSVPMWRRRKLASGGGIMFPSARGGYQDPNNVINRFREALDDLGYDWVTPHVWRATVATILDEAGLPTTAIADQLGNSPKIIEGHYRKRRASNADAVAVLNTMWDKPDQDQQSG